MTERATRGPGRPVAASAAETRARVVKAALEIFNEVGYAGTTYREVAARSYLSRPAIHHYFPAKRDLYRACIDDINERLIAVALAEAGEKTTVEGRIRAFRKAQSRDPGGVAFLVTATVESQRNPELYEEGNAVLESTRMFVRWVVAGAAATGELIGDPDDPHLVEMLVALICGLSFYAGYGTPEETDHITERFLTLLCGDGAFRST